MSFLNNGWTIVNSWPKACRVNFTYLYNLLKQVRRLDNKCSRPTVTASSKVKSRKTSFNYALIAGTSDFAVRDIQSADELASNSSHTLTKIRWNNVEN